MKPQADRREASNPFSTRFVRPGAVPFQFPPEHQESKQSLDKLVDRLSSLGSRAQVIGPHGSGKSTLVRQLLAVLAQRGLPSYLVSLHDGERHMPAGWATAAQDAAARLVIVDGYEQLSAWNRWALKFHCRSHGWQLLVTAHQDVGLPTLFRTATDLATARSIVAHLVASSDKNIDEKSIADSFATAGGNVRDMLFALYDRYEQHTRRESS